MQMWSIRCLIIRRVYDIELHRLAVDSAHEPNPHTSTGSVVSCGTVYWRPFKCPGRFNWSALQLAGCESKGCRGAVGHGNLRAIRHKWANNRWCEQIIVAGQALKNTDRSDYLFTGSTQSALTPAKHLRTVRDEVQLESVPLTSMDQCAMVHQGKWPCCWQEVILIFLNILTHEL